MSDKMTYLAKLAAGGLNRRTFLSRAGAIGVSAAMANGIYASNAHAAAHMTPRKGGTIRVGIQGGASTDTLDPALAANATASQTIRMWGEPLVELAADGGLDPRVAESFSSSPDATVWTFNVRAGITFSNGQPVTAEDCRATLERHAGEDSKSGALGLLRDITGLRAEGNSLIVELSAPNADLPYLMTDYHLMIQPNGGKDDPTAAIGTGPYMLRENEQGVRSVWDKNPSHWDDTQGHADTIELIVINDDTARVAAIQSGQVHMVNRVPPKVASLVGRMPGIEVKSTAGPGHYVFIMHANTAPFDNKDLRLALKYAMNREEMVEKILFGNGTVGNDTPINSAYPLYSDDIPQRTYDPEMAAKHFAASGHEGPVLLRTSDNSFPGAPDAAQLFQQSAKAAGIDVQIKREPNDGYWSEVWNNQPFCTSYWGGRPTQDAMFSTAYLSTADWNDTRFFNARFDELLVQARSELDTDKRKAMYREMSMLVREDGGLICPMFNNFVDAVSDDVTGWAPSVGFELMNFYAPARMWLKA
jgi:peptide/nickel transport system substrate-binding protein